MHWYLLSADSRPFLRHLTLPPLSPDTYESLVLAYLGIFLFDTDHLDIADRSAIDIWPSLPCLQTRTSLTCISIPRNLFFFYANFIFFWCVYHVEILDSSIEVQGNIFFDANQFLFWYLWGYFFWCVFIFFWSFTRDHSVMFCIIHSLGFFPCIAHFFHFHQKWCFLFNDVSLGSIINSLMVSKYGCSLSGRMIALLGARNGLKFWNHQAWKFQSWNHIVQFCKLRRNCTAPRSVNCTAPIFDGSLLEFSSI